MKQDILIELQRYEKEIEQAKRERGQAEGRLEVALKQLADLSVTEQNAADTLKELDAKITELYSMAEKEFEELKERWEV